MVYKYLYIKNDTFMGFFFVPGVCNTDNFSLLSITIDYGPFGFMEAYNPSMRILSLYLFKSFRIRGVCLNGHTIPYKAIQT